MSVQPIGLVTLVVGLCCLLFGPALAMRSLVVLSMFGAAAALFLGSGGQVQPAHLFLAFAVPTVLSRRNALRAALNSMTFPAAGFWLLCVALLGVVGAFLLPRLFAGATQVFTVEDTDAGLTFLLNPLMPVGTNMTQAVYLLADLACFVTVVGFCGLDGGRAALGRALVGYAALNVAFALLDLATFYTGTGAAFDPVRNAGYMMHSDEVASGLKRIVGTFPETSSFSSATLGMLAYTGTLWLRRRWAPQAGALAAASAALLALSTSSTAIVGGALVAALLYVSALRRLGRGRGGRAARLFVLGAPLLAGAAACSILLDGGVRAALDDYLGTLVYSKAASQSGLERASWNAAAFQNWIDTYGLGAGLGSVHASSFPLAVGANLGVPGCALFAGFFWQMFAAPPGPPSLDADLRAAARAGAFALLVAATISGGLVDLGLEFFLLAGLACSVGERAPERAVARAGRPTLGVYA